MTATIRKTLLDALDVYQSDSLERAEFAFRGFTPAQMAQQYGQSGQTRQEVLDGYRQHRAIVTTAREWVENQPESGE